jgi:hypothetical protein
MTLMLDRGQTGVQISGRLETEKDIFSHLVPENDLE